MTVWQKRRPRWRLLWFRIKMRGCRLHPWEYVCDVEDCKCCTRYVASPSEADGWERTSHR